MERIDLHPRLKQLGFDYKVVIRHTAARHWTGIEWTKGDIKVQVGEFLFVRLPNVPFVKVKVCNRTILYTQWDYDKVLQTVIQNLP